MSGSHDKLPGLFWVQLVLAAIVFILFLTADKPAKTAHASTTQGDTKEAVKEVVKQAAKNLEPVGAVAVKEEAIAAKGGGKSGEEVYNETCGVCHNAGVAGAPKLDDKAAWETRLQDGFSALVASSIKGKGGMPPRGGNPAITDSEMELAVSHMIKKADIVLVAKSVNGSMASASMEKKEEPAAPKMAETPSAPAAPAAPTAPDTSATATTTAMATKEAAPAAASPSAERIAQGEKVYKGACFACHDAGVAGSPKTGDIAAWTARIAAGNDAMYNAAINGKGVMPPKGGNMSISDDDVKAAVDYMVSKSM